MMVSCVVVVVVNTVLTCTVTPKNVLTKNKWDCVMNFIYHALRFHQTLSLPKARGFSSNDIHRHFCFIYFYVFFFILFFLTSWSLQNLPFVYIKYFHMAFFCGILCFILRFFSWYDVFPSFRNVTLYYLNYLNYSF